MGLVER
jgi:hypothetical protein